MSDEPLSAVLRESTKAMHRLAERNAFMGELLAGRLAREGYLAYLRNLHALYEALEGELAGWARRGPVPSWILPALFRRDAIAADLSHLGGPSWRGIPIARATAGYADRLLALSGAQPHRLAAHAYVRYLGDLSGGQVIRGVIGRAYGLGDGPGTDFYDFSSAGEAETLKATLRHAFDDYGASVGPESSADISQEAVDAFARHRDLLEELRVAWPGG